MGDIGMIKGGACLVAQTRRRVVVDVVDHSASTAVSRSTEEKRGKKAVNIKQT